jgi:hypothetical protein
MIAKEKAEELYIEYWHLLNDSRIAKKCALKAVDVLIKEMSLIKEIYWQKVKQEIEKL